MFLTHNEPSILSPVRSCGVALLLCAVGFFFMTAPRMGATSGAAAIGINFASGNTNMAASEVAGVVAQNNWNNANGASSSSPLSLVNQTGSPSGATVSWTADNTWLSGAVVDQAGNARMMRGYLDTGNSHPTVVTVSNLNSGTYNIYVYTDGDNGTSTRTGTYQLSGPGITPTLIGMTDAPNTNFAGTFVQASNSNGNYVLFSSVPVGSGFTVTATPGQTSDIYPRAVVNGIQIVPVSQAPPDFTLTVNPASQTVNPGASTTYTATITPLNGFSGTVSLAVTGLPNNASASFSPVNGAGNSILTIATSTSTPLGSSTLTITGTSGSLSHSSTVTFVVATGSGTAAIGINFASGNTNMAASEVAGVVAQNNWNNANGASSSSPLSLVNQTGSPSGATVSWTADNTWLSGAVFDQAGNARMMRGYLDTGNSHPTVVTVSNLNSGTYNIYVYTDGDNGTSTRTGTYQLSGPGITPTLIGMTDVPNTNFAGTFVQANNSNGNYVLFSSVPVGSGFTVTATPGQTSDIYPRAVVNGIQIVPVSQAPPDFTLTVNPASQTVNPGASTTYTATITPLNGFSGTVSLAVTGLPNNASASFSPVNGAGNSILTIATSTSTPLGSSTLTITGTSGSLSHSSTVNFVVATGSGSAAIGINFASGNTNMAASEVAGVVAQNNWNNANGASSSSPLSLVNQTGNPSGATVSWTADNTWLSGAVFDQAGNARMMRGYLDTGNSHPTVVTVSNLNSGTYNIYVYTDGDNGTSTRTGTYQLSGPGITPTLIGMTDAPNTNFAGTFVQASNSNGNYVLFSSVPVGSGFTVTATPGQTSDIYPRAVVNGIQIVPVSQASPYFTLTVNPASQTVNPGASTTYTATITPLNGFSGTVSLAATGLPNNASASFGPVNGAGNSILTVATSTSPPLGSSTPTTTGTSGSQSHSATVTFVVATRSASAAIGINFASGNTNMAASEVAGVVAQNNWNNANGASSSSPLSLVNQTGSPSGATVSWTADNTWLSGAVVDQAGNARMMRGYLDTGNSHPTVVTVSNLNSGTYNIYVYTDGDNGTSTRTGTYQLSGPGITPTLIGMTDAPNTNFAG